MKKRKRKYVSLAALLLVVFFCSIQEFIHKNEGISISSGSKANGSMENAWLLEYREKNYEFFSPLSYYILDNAYVHNKVWNTVIETYELMAAAYPDRRFKVMETARQNGGQMLIHRTHQTGLSVDFMVPKIRKQNENPFWDKIGMLHYLLDFDPEGRLIIDKKTKIDFECMAQHILALNETAKKNGLEIRMIIFKTNLKDDLFNTPSGKKLKQSGIYFARSLQPIVNRVHDDHYHVDFKIRS